MPEAAGRPGHGDPSTQPVHDYAGCARHYVIPEGSRELRFGLYRLNVHLNHPVISKYPGFGGNCIQRHPQS